MQTINLDLSVKSIIPLLHAKQGDVGRKFKAILSDGGVAYPVPAGAAVSIWYSGASGEGNYTNVGANSAVSVSGNEIVVEMIAQMLANYGVGTMCIVIHTADGDQLGTWNIPYMVEPMPGMGSAAAQAYFTAFSKAVEDLAYPDASLSAPGKAAEAAAVGAALAGKAPAGYGLGEENGGALTSDTVGMATKNGIFYYYAANTPNLVPGFNSLRGTVVIEGNSRFKTQKFTANNGYTALRTFTTEDSGEYGEWEYINPPMAPGVEYRTTERYNGSPVYTQLVDFGAVTNGAKLSSPYNIIRYSAKLDDWYILPFSNASGSFSNNYSAWLDMHNGSCTFYCGSSLSSNNLKVQFWYIM